MGAEMSIEAMKLALDCLEDIFGKEKIDVGAINALRQAIAEAEKQEPVACPFPCGWKRLFEIIVADGAFLARSLEEGEAITEHQREVVMHMIGYAKDMALHGMKAIREALAQSDQESDDLTIAYMSGFHDGKNKDAPQREWVGLTGSEVVEAYCSVSEKEWAIGGLDDARVFFCAIEAKLREKNGC